MTLLIKRCALRESRYINLNYWAPDTRYTYVYVRTHVYVYRTSDGIYHNAEFRNARMNVQYIKARVLFVPIQPLYFQLSRDLFENHPVFTNRIYANNTNLRLRESFISPRARTRAARIVRGACCLKTKSARFRCSRLIPRGLLTERWRKKSRSVTSSIRKIYAWPEASSPL